jgi:anaerobic magnesium-protoporphyrin IX monomethyl ester cyclase
MDETMRVLLIIPPYVPSYFNAGHHLPVFQVGSYLRRHCTGLQVTCIDAGALNYTWKDVCDLLIRPFDVIALFNDFDAVDTFERFVAYARRLCPAAKLVTFGRLSKQIPGFFERFGFDFIVASGDYEAGVQASIEALASGHPASALPGVRVRSKTGWVAELPSTFLDAEAWAFPDPAEIPYAAYDNMYADDSKKFCGIPQRRELVVPAVRGCPVGCEFCDVPGMQGRRERRVAVERVLEYIERSFREHPFEYVSFYAPTFTLDKAWVRQLCAALGQLPRRYPWKCVTTTAHLDEGLVQTMAASGCVRISVGLETLDAAAHKSLPKLKRVNEATFEEIAGWCNQHGIELNCFVILGLPGDSPGGVRLTVEKVLEVGARVRPTIYTPYHLLRDDMSVAQVGELNRQLFLRGTQPEAIEQLYYELFYANADDRITEVMAKIPRNAEHRDAEPTEAPDREARAQ